MSLQPLPNHQTTGYLVWDLNTLGDLWELEYVHRFVNHRFGCLQDVVTWIPDTSYLIFTHPLLPAIKCLLYTKHLWQDCYEHVIGHSTECTQNTNM